MQAETRVLLVCMLAKARTIRALARQGTSHERQRETESGRSFLKRERECESERQRERGAKRKHRNGTLNRLSIRETN